MNSYIKVGNISVATELYDLIDKEISPKTGITSVSFWKGFEDILVSLGPRNRSLLSKRDHLQDQIDNWHRNNPYESKDIKSYKNFLFEIGYLVKEGDDFKITTSNVDDEIATIAGPQLVVPVMNARFALNAANARWGSLFDALYGSDIFDDSDELKKTPTFNENRGKAVIDYANNFLDKALPLEKGHHRDVKNYNLTEQSRTIELINGQETKLKTPEQFIGYNHNQNIKCLFFKNNGLHIELQIDRSHPIGLRNLSGVKDIILESAITTIQDLEDSIAAVDAKDKVIAYRNWFGLMNGTLNDEFIKDNKKTQRTLVSDKRYIGLDGNEKILSGRSLLLIRNVGHLVTCDAVLDAQGNPCPEGFLDVLVTSLAALHDVKKLSPYKNSQKSNIYIVKPKMHGPEEVALTNDLFDKVEDILGLTRYTIKVGVMDEERRTTVNLKEVIRAVKNRIVFINTGFLDRTGDEIHTSMEAGPFLPKEDIKKQVWISAYENWNVDTGLECGLKGKAQIGKGMWPKPDAMKQMMEQKIAHPKSGANCAWVPSPTAATLHAMHYHQINVSSQQDELLKRPKANLDDILTLSLLGDRKLTQKEIEKELDNNLQGLLGYVVRWIDQGIGCSKVPDINNVYLMEDRATLRISSQHIANWLHHNICSKEQVLERMKVMAEIVDEQNKLDPHYKKMMPDYEKSIAFTAACDLVFKGRVQPNGYTEPVLHSRRRQIKGY
jgi:malate synthase